MLVQAAAGRGAARLEYGKEGARSVAVASRGQRLTRGRGVVREVVVVGNAARRADQILAPAHALEARQAGADVGQARAEALRACRQRGQGILQVVTAGR